MTRLFPLWLCLFFLPLPVFPRQAATTASRITLDVVVNDKSGNPVSGLQQQNFTILDNQQPQKILSFEAIGGNSPANADLETVLVIDAVNIGLVRVAFAREEIQKFLRQDGGKLAQPLSIDFLSDSGLVAQATPTRDGNALIAYMKQHETALRTLRGSQGFYGAADRVQLSLRALGQLAQYEENRPGRKLVIWVSPGWPILTGPNVQLTSKDQQNLFHTVVAVSTQLRQSRIALYAVDPLGTSDSGSFRTFYYEQFLKGVTAPNRVLIGNLALQVLAYQSGGRVLNSSNSIAGEIERCIRDVKAYYVLTYDPPPADGPDDYHAIEVKLDQPQLKAQTRSGYYAQPTRPRTP
ncbi:MAG TPA: VWA domain-containing protein [Bryobacteraceae bacterium]|jgi:VWFA-related protein|nr:VWA domain-containing protein [Bryobacteraceae bacterium]